MKLIELSPETLSGLYETEMRSAFPPEELKPLGAMLSMMEQGRYRPLGLYEGEELLGYAMLWLEPGVPFALLDYLGTLEGKRNRGLGTAMLALMAEYCGEELTLFGESEAPENGAPEGEPLRRRRLAFYQRNGFRYGGYDCALFGVHYRTLIRGRPEITPQALLKAHQAIYRRHMPAHIYQKFIQLPLAPGETPQKPERWTEE